MLLNMCYGVGATSVFFESTLILIVHGKGRKPRVAKIWTRRIRLQPSVPRETMARPPWVRLKKYTPRAAAHRAASLRCLLACLLACLPSVFYQQPTQQRNNDNNAATNTSPFANSPTTQRLCVAVVILLRGFGIVILLYC